MGESDGVAARHHKRLLTHNRIGTQSVAGTHRPLSGHMNDLSSRGGAREPKHVRRWPLTIAVLGPYRHSSVARYDGCTWMIYGCTWLREIRMAREWDADG